MGVDRAGQTAVWKRVAPWHAGDYLASSLDLGKMPLRIKACMQAGTGERADRRQSGSQHCQRNERLE
jgi:hypothetical protein